MSLLFVLAAGVTALASPEKVDADLRCMVASELLFARAPTANAAQEIKGIILYFLGRIEVEVAEADLPRRLSNVLRATPGGAWQDESKRCFAELEQAGQRLKTMGALAKAQGQ